MTVRLGGMQKCKRSFVRKRSIQFCGMDIADDSVPGGTLGSYGGLLPKPGLGGYFRRCNTVANCWGGAQRI